MTDFKLGTMFGGRYRVLGELGSGGMGAVLLVLDTKTNEERALKYCTSTDATSLRRFQREVRAMKKVTHPNVVAILDDALDDSPPYFIMPLAEGSLLDEMEELSSDVEAALEAIIQVCLGVEEMHINIGPHRDLKPHNALRMSDGRVVVCDLGLAKIEPRDTTVLTKTMQRLGSLAYSAPEQFLPGGSRNADHITDVYQIGATAYHLFTGVLPMPLDADRLPLVLKRIVRTATQSERTKRYPSVAELREDFQQHLDALKSPLAPHEELDKLLQKATELLATDKYRKSNIQAILDVVCALRNTPHELVEQFDRIPDRILKIAAKKLPGSFTSVLQAYCDSLDDTVGGQNWSYADRVADKMYRRIFMKTEDPSVRVCSARACLIAAVRLNRYDAMDTFGAMLQQVETKREAVLMLDMLRQEKDRYAMVANRVEARDLHLVLRRFRNEVVDESG